jgi:hypothetical protein
MDSPDDVLILVRQSLAEAGLRLSDDASADPRGGVRLAPIATPPAVRVS